jgi:hypothetical protein
MNWYQFTRAVSSGNSTSNARRSWKVRITGMTDCPRFDKIAGIEGLLEDLLTALRLLLSID